MIDPVLPTYNRAKLSLDRGKGSYVFDEQGEAYLDFGGGVAVISCGHAHPHLVQALTDQAQKLWHCSNLYQMPGQEKLARRLVDHSFADTVFFANSGAEALECAIKMARKYQSAKGKPERFRIITFTGAFHGRTLATLAAGGQEKYLAGFGPKVDGFDQVAVGDLDAVAQAIGAETAAILIEPIQGEGGIRVHAPEFLQGLRRLCDEHGLLLIFDEVQTGVGRTGKFFAYERSGVAPDIMALAKGLGGGFPIGACLATEEAACGMTFGTHASTFGGNPLATAVANAVLDIILDEKFLSEVQRKSLLLKQKLAGLQDHYPGIIADIRGEGLLVGIKPHIAQAEFQAALLNEKLLSVLAGDNVVRLLPPLTVSDEEIGLAVEKIAQACGKLSPTKGGKP